MVAAPSATYGHPMTSQLKYQAEPLGNNLKGLLYELCELGFFMNLLAPIGPRFTVEIIFYFGGDFGEIFAKFGLLSKGM